MNINCYDLYNTVIKNRDENKDIDNQHENDYNDFITPNHYVRQYQGRWRSSRS